MPGPNLTFAIILATLCGATFHFIIGGDARRLSVFILAGWLGFAMGQFLGTTFEMNVLSIGNLYLLPALIGALLCLAVAWVLTSNRSRRRSPR